MSGFEAIISEIRSRGADAVATSESLAEVDLAGAISGVAAPLPPGSGASASPEASSRSVTRPGR
ncbi:hypothetical protein [Haloechinothrix sp. LS1_15]|uniref:hypothetical protein n=1 Tax=Haloechinothrix sp. LS1_15 TaxID=2652248 RepID=UPI0029485267|nr:hypothetical protein [Haloechinothrix sp. LS1_15]MDV6013733.1 hypothetical protein [Haloechinothrix sp. LS1_15]